MTSTNEWYTPPRHIEAVHQTMGGIDLDPASCALANKTVKAKRYYSIEDNGLVHSWWGNVYLNPPFGLTRGKSNQALWSHYLIRQYKCGNVKQGILLVTANTEVTWFDPLYEYPICLVRKRLNYITPTPDNFMKTHQSRFGTCFVYLGPNESRFVDIFGEFGRIVKAIDVPKPKPISLQLWGVEEGA